LAPARPEFPPAGAGLRLGADGLWRPAEHEAEVAAVSYPEGGHDACFEVEDGSFWFRHRSRCIVAAMRRHPPPLGAWLWDIGGGNGVVAAALAAAGQPVVLLEPGLAGARNALRRGLTPVVCGEALSCGLPPGSIAAAGLFDVVEHIADDVGYLRGLHRLLQPGGRLYLTAPAHPALWSQEDIDAGHCRRHTLASMHRLLSAGGYEPIWSSYFFRPLPLPIAILRSLPFRLGLRPRRDPMAMARRGGATGPRRGWNGCWRRRLP
jgi:SAM-dependent methyltransferase